ncbi:MAG: hypothetical protein V1913_15090 [Fibrobacterota bacterium]
MQLPRVTEIISPPNDFAQVLPDVLERACLRGSSVHEACAAYALGLFSPVPDDLIGYFNSFRRYFDAYVVEVVAVEVELIHPAFRYIGHADMIARVRGYKKIDVVAVLDWKTPLVANPKWRMQCQAYVEAARAQYGAEIGGALQLNKDGKLPKMTWVTDNNTAFSAFLGMLNGYNYINGR